MPTTTKPKINLLLLSELLSDVRLDKVVPIKILSAKPGSIPKFPNKKSRNVIFVKLMAKLKVMKGMTGQRRTRKTSFTPYISIDKRNIKLPPFRQPC